jgi:hypothetical protein
LEISLCTPETFDYDRVCSVRAYEGFDVGCHAVTSATSPSVIVISGNFAADVIENAKVRVKLAVAEIKGDRRGGGGGELISHLARDVTKLTVASAC